MRNVLIVALMLAVAGTVGCAGSKKSKKKEATTSSTTTKKKKKTVAKKKPAVKRPAPYADSVREAFLTACTAETPEPQCTCALRKLQRTVPAEELGGLEPAARAKIMSDCVEAK